MDKSGGSSRKAVKGNSNSSRDVVISSGNKLYVQQAKSRSYKIVGSNRNVPGWVYEYDSTRGVGEWRNKVMPDGPWSDYDDVGECVVTYDQTTKTMTVGADGRHCYITKNYSTKAPTSTADASDTKSIIEIMINPHHVSKLTACGLII